MGGKRMFRVRQSNSCYRLGLARGTMAPTERRSMDDEIWIYDNWVHRYVKLHRAECSHRHNQQPNKHTGAHRAEGDTSDDYHCLAKALRHGGNDEGNHK